MNKVEKGFAGASRLVEESLFGLSALTAAVGQRSAFSTQKKACCKPGLKWLDTTIRIVSSHSRWTSMPSIDDNIPQYCFPLGFAVPIEGILPFEAAQAFFWSG